MIMYCFPKMLNMCKEIFAVTEMRTSPFVCVCVCGGGGGGEAGVVYGTYLFVCVSTYLSLPIPQTLQ